MRRCEITKAVSINCNIFHLLHHASGQMRMTMIISEPAIEIINKCNKPQTTSHSDFMYVLLGCYLPIQLMLKSLSSVCDVRSFSPCTDSICKLRDLQCFMFEKLTYIRTYIHRFFIIKMTDLLV